MRYLKFVVFPITTCDDLSTVLARTHSELSDLCADFISCIYSEGEEFIKERLTASKSEVWRGKARLLKDLDALQKMEPNISAKELR